MLFRPGVTEGASHTIGRVSPRERSAAAPTLFLSETQLIRNDLSISGENQTQRFLL